MTTQEALEVLNKNVKIPSHMLDKLCKWRGVYHGISLHTLGAAPWFTDLRTGRKIKPNNYINEEYQQLFDVFLLNRHQREDDATRSIRYANYRPLTKAPFAQITEILSGAIFQESNYQIEVLDQKDSEFIWGNNFYGFDIAGYFANIGIKNMSEDPNGLFIRVPAKPFYEQDAAKVEVDIWFVNTPDIVWYDKSTLIFKREEFAYYIDNQTIWRSEKSNTKEYESFTPYYAHMFGYLPCTVAGGEWNTQGYYDSFFDKAKGAADDFISSYSAAQMVDKEASHPIIETVPDDCPQCHGQKQLQAACGCDGLATCQQCNGTNIVLVDCGGCGGSGTQSVYPGRWKQIPQESFKDGTIRYNNPDVSINTHNRAVAKELLTILKESLHLYNTDKSESGEAKAIDQERRYNFLTSVSNQLFDKIIYDCVRDIIAYRNVRSTGTGIQPYIYDFKIVKPTQFIIKTSDELFEQLDAATKSNLPSVIRQRIASDYVKKEYNGDTVLEHKMYLVNQIDTLGMYPTANWLSLRAAGAISERDMIINRMLPTWLEDLYKDKGEAFLGVTKEQVIEYINPLIDKEKPPVIDLGEDEPPV